MRALCAALVLAAAACQLPGIDRQRLPEALIAVHYRTPEEVRARDEVWETRAAAQPERAAPRNATRRAGSVPHLDEIRDLLGRVLGRPDAAQPPRSGSLALLDPRSGELRRVENVAQGAVPQAWSVDRKRLLYRVADGSRVQLWELELASKSVRPLTRGSRSHPEGCYAGQGRLVVTVLDHSRDPLRSWIALTGPGGRGPYRMLSEGPADHSPSCSPDGHRVVWVDEARPDRPRLRGRLLEEGAALRELSAGTGPSFSPDGRWLVFSSRSGQLWRLWRMRWDGTARAPVGGRGLDALAPSISPDGLFVVFVASQQPPHRLLRVAALAGDAEVLLPLEGEADSPVW